MGAYTIELTAHQHWCKNSGMAIVEIRIDPEHAGSSKEELPKLLDSEIEKFSTFMANLDDWRARGPLINSEKAILKTYLMQKLAGKLD